MHIFYDDATGGINSLWPDPPQSVSDAKAAKGLALIEAPWPDGGDRADYLVQEGALLQKPAPTTAQALDAAKDAAIGELIQTTKHFIRHKPDGRIRYDEDLKLNLLWAAVNADKAGTARPEPTTQVSAWIEAVQQAYKQKFEALQAAAGLAAVAAVDVGYEWFEERYGVGGTVLADPDKSTQDLMNQV